MSTRVLVACRCVCPLGVPGAVTPPGGGRQTPLWLGWKGARGRAARSWQLPSRETGTAPTQALRYGIFPATLLLDMTSVVL